MCALKLLEIFSCCRSVDVAEATVSSSCGTLEVAAAVMAGLTAAPGKVLASVLNDAPASSASSPSSLSSRRCCVSKKSRSSSFFSGAPLRSLCLRVYSLPLALNNKSATRCIASEPKPKGQFDARCNVFLWTAIHGSPRFLDRIFPSAMNFLPGNVQCGSSQICLVQQVLVLLVLLARPT